MMANIVNNWKIIGDKVAAANKNEDNMIPVNQPLTGPEKTAYEEDDESYDLLLHQMEEKRETPARLLQINFDNDDNAPFVMDLPEEEWQRARDFHSRVGFTAV
jgi:hypothetical protein